MIGIFWIHNNKIYSYKEEDLSQTDQDVEVGHVDYWQTLQAKYKELREYSYDYIPRGRVLLKNGETVVYSSHEVIDNDHSKELILKSYELNSASFVYDEHYQKIYDLGFEYEI